MVTALEISSVISMTLHLEKLWELSTEPRREITRQIPMFPALLLWEIQNLMWT